MLSGVGMRSRWMQRLLETNKELLLIFSIIASAGVINFFVAGQRLVLTFYNLPTLFAAYYFGRKRAVQTAVASILIVGWLNLMNPEALGTGLTFELGRLLSWSDLGIWTGFLLVSAYATGTLYEHRERTIAELREAYHGLLQILSQFISKDKYTYTHSYRVSFYATQIARQMGLPAERIEDVRAAALLHDIGKLELSREVLYKAAQLTEEEIAELRTHVDKGVRMLSPVGGTLKRVLPIILAHHEKYDGNGYQKRKAEEIPLEARILSVADVYDALTSDRPYRKGMSPLEARDDIVKRAGTDFDPRVVKAFEAAFRNGLLEVPEAFVYAS